MKKNLLLLAFAFLGLAVSAQDSIISIPKASKAITIDGTIDDTWASAPNFVINQWGTGKETPSESDFSASFKLLWDDNNLYFLGVIVDDNLMNSEAISGAGIVDWEVDNFELYWSPGNSKLADQTEMTQVRLAYANAASDDPAPGVYSEGGFAIGEFVTAAKATTNDGYVFECAFDLAASAEASGKDQIGLNDTVGFNAVACDNDGEANRENIGGIITGFKYNQADTLLRLVLTNAVTAITSQKTSSLRMFPNPATNVVYVKGAQVNSIEIFNLSGQAVLKASNSGNSINVSMLPKGIYSARVNTASGTLIEKLVKHKVT